MKKYLAFDGINFEYEDFETIEEAQKWLEECFLDSDEGYYKGYSDATKEACQEIREHYHPNDR